jgi:hypothetical protein
MICDEKSKMQRIPIPQKSKKNKAEKIRNFILLP